MFPKCSRYGCAVFGILLPNDWGEYLTFVSFMKSKYEFRIDCNKNVLFVHDMSLLSILHDTGLLNALEGKCTIGDTLIIFLGERPFLRVVRMFRNWPLTLTSLTNPKPPAPRALTIWRSSKPAFSIWAFIILVGRSGSYNTDVKSLSQSWQIVKMLTKLTSIFSGWLTSEILPVVGELNWLWSSEPDLNKIVIYVGGFKHKEYNINNLWLIMNFLILKISCRDSRDAFSHQEPSEVVTNDNDVTMTSLTMTSKWSTKINFVDKKYEKFLFCYVIKKMAKSMIISISMNFEWIFEWKFN